ncbi:FecR family protein [Arcticibacter tournemirensis]|nr:FecR domain-containing protein [Arcticibacter tournemirensis]
MNRELINGLIEKYKNGSATEAEKQTLMNWYREVAEEESVFPGAEHDIENQMLQRLQLDIKPVNKRNNLRLWAAAASILLVLSAGVLLLKSHLIRPGTQSDTELAGNAISPGGNKAFLTLANGTKISLTDAQAGEVATQGGIQIKKTGEGQIMYVISDQKQKAAKTTEYNTIETPRGGQYKLLLPDGTVVWLNAVSSVRFPVNFSSQKERRVELTGEAYFDVAQDKDLPFRVVARGQEVEVLGTSFNISAFPDEQESRTTLVQGAVKISAGNSSVQLRPGQQAAVTGSIHVKNIDPAEAVAWKNGYFRFDDEPLESIMRQISRWYDVDVTFAGEPLKSELFAAAAKRSTGISELLSVMEQTGDVKFDIDGSHITVRKKNK